MRLVGHVERSHPPEKFDLYFQFPAAYSTFLNELADPFAAAMLIPAMKAGDRLEIGVPVSQGFTFNLSRIRDVFHSWFPELARVEIESVKEQAAVSDGPSHAASFFSGGVDSFYTLLRYRHADRLPVPLTHCIFMRGIETELERTRGVENSERLATEVAQSTGIECIIGETNLRSHFPMNWEAHYVGSALAATALALGGGLRYVCIPSSYSYMRLIPGGSSALVDEMYSTPSTRILYDGADASRADKVTRITRWRRDLVTSHLRVCAANFGGAFNCGQCYKCVRTAIALHVLGVLENSRMFINQSKSHWKRVALTDHIGLLEENLALAEREGSDATTTELLRQIVRRRRRRAALRAFVSNTWLESFLWMAPKRWIR